MQGVMPRQAVRRERSRRVGDAAPVRAKNAANTLCIASKTRFLEESPAKARELLVCRKGTYASLFAIVNRKLSEPCILI
jgi:hypothetical protein